jgi:hypothetical protein
LGAPQRSQPRNSFFVELMLVKVYHRKTSKLIVLPREEHLQVDLKDFDLVATINARSEHLTDALHEVWRVTQNFDIAWTELAKHQAGTEIYKDPARSSMVGDVYEVDGLPYVVWTMGFRVGTNVTAAV